MLTDLVSDEGPLSGSYSAFLLCLQMVNGSGCSLKPSLYNPIHEDSTFMICQPQRPHLQITLSLRIRFQYMNLRVRGGGGLKHSASTTFLIVKTGLYLFYVTFSVLGLKSDEASGCRRVKEGLVQGCALK